MKTGPAVALLALIVLGIAVAVTVARLSGKPAVPEVVVYSSVDKAHAEPILNDFAAQTGIRVKPVYATEDAKAPGLAQRLVAEKDQPHADVFWDGGFGQTMELRDRGMLAPHRSPSASDLPADAADPKGLWTSVGGRAHALLIHRNRVPPDARPKKLEDLLTSTIPGERIGMAWPFHGTAATHAAALYAAWGPGRARKFFADLKARGIRFADDNDVVRNLIVQGELWMGLTDSGTAQAALEKEAPVEMILLDQEENGLGTLLIPATVSLIVNGPNAEEGRTLVDYLVSDHAEKLMVKRGFSQYPLRSAAKALRPMRVSPDDIWKQWPVAQRELQEVLGAKTSAGR